MTYTGDPAQTAATAASFSAAGAEFVVIYLLRPHTPAVLEPLASAFSEVS